MSQFIVLYLIAKCTALHYVSSETPPKALLPIIRRQSTHVEVGQGEIKDEELSYHVNSLSSKLKFLLKLKQHLKDPAKFPMD